MSFWSKLFGSPNHAGVTPNDNTSPADPPTVGGADYTPGDPDGFEIEKSTATPQTFHRVAPSPWDGWPAEWSTPAWDWNSRFNALVDIAWACIDLNARVLSAMPVYQTRGGAVIDPKTWMTNPDRSIYTSWQEFAKQLFRDYFMGEVFVLPMSFGADGFPLTFRVIPPWAMHVEMRNARRDYRLGGSTGVDVTEDILHIRYDSDTGEAHGRGPLEVAGGRKITAGLIEKYTREVVSNGGVPLYTLETEDSLTEGEAQDLMQQWVLSRKMNLGAPPVLDNGATLKTHQAMSPKDMAMIEIAQFTETRICTLLGVPPFMVGLPSGGSESMTYSNVSQVFDQWDRTTINPAATSCMSAMSGWALPSTQGVELNRDEVSRPDFATRMDTYVKAVGAGIMTPEEVRDAERLRGGAPEQPDPASDRMPPIHIEGTQVARRSGFR